MKPPKQAESAPEASLKSFNRYRFFFYGSWLLLNFIQAAFTQLQDDEAYYWVYAKFLDWGYFDHPPLIAVLVKIGTMLLPGEVGVRLLFILMNVGTIYICELLTDRRNPILFYSICLSVAVLQISGYWAVPDVPLMFFTALFFYIYKRFLEHSNWLNTLLLAITVAALFYSKYHSILVVALAVTAHIAVLRNPKIYLAGLLVLVLYLPHLLWQYNHDWVTFRFQLFENKAHPYQLNFTLDYLFGQLLIAGPIVGLVLLYSTFKYKHYTLIEKILKRTAIGILVFFLLSTLRGQVEANWTAPVLISMLVLTYSFLQQKVLWRKWLFRLLPLSFAIIVFARAVMIFDILPGEPIVERFHAWKKWPQVLHSKTENLPVVFYDSYQRASMYWFHTGKMAYSLNTITQRRSNYNYWPVEDSLLGKQVYRAGIYNVHEFGDSIQARMWKIGFTKDDNFHSFAKVAIQPTENSYAIQENDLLAVQFKIHIPPVHSNYLKLNPHINEQVKLIVYKKQTVVKEYDLPISLREILENSTGSVELLCDLPKGNYGFIFSISSNYEQFTHNSMKVQLNVE